MSNLENGRIWQVEVGGEIYDASFGELGSWIDGGSLLPDDKVRKGNLRWIEARKVPGLAPFFNARSNGEPLPIVIYETDIGNASALPLINGVAENAASTNETRESAAFVEKVAFGQAEPRPENPDPGFCVTHPEIESEFLCETCCNGFCRTCPSSYGSTVKICPLCGAMCKPALEVRASAERLAAISLSASQGFGISDFFAALSHPFKFKTSLFFGALLFALFTFGQSVTAIGGIFMFASALICTMLANMLTFGVLANTVENFVQGKLNSDFMPRFDDFSILDDVIHPFFLSIAAYLVSFGPFILTAVIGIYLVLNSVSSQMQTFQSEIERLPGTQYYAGREPVEQSQQVKKVLGDVSDKRAALLERHNEAAIGSSGDIDVPPADDNLELWNENQEGRKRELEAAFGKTAETREKEFEGMMTAILRLAAPLVIIGGIAFLWGMFFFPAACAVAGYSRSVTATINPFVGLDTIRRLGAGYLKILLMGICLVFISLLAGGVFALILSPFDLPGMGNIPASVLSSFVTFYLSVVFSCILGYALFKNAHKLDLAR